MELTRWPPGNSPRGDTVPALDPIPLGNRGIPGGAVHTALVQSAITNQLGVPAVRAERVPWNLNQLRLA